MFRTAFRRSWKPAVLASLAALLTLVAVESGGAAPPRIRLDPAVLDGIRPQYPLDPVVINGIHKWQFLRLAKQHNLDTLNSYRAKAGAPPLQFDTGMDSFAWAGSQELMQDHVWHKHNTDAYVPYDGKTGKYWECQGYNYGVPIVGWPNSYNFNATVDQILAQMMAEPLPPAGKYNHHSIIIDPKHTRVGVGLVVDSNKGLLYLTNDFNP